jgi:hypothetical protein
MKRRNFLKSIIGAASAVAIPSLALAKDNIVVRKGLPSAYFDLMENVTANPLVEMSWEYRGWDVRFKSKNWKEGLEIYRAIRNSQYIHLEIDSSLVDLYAKGEFTEKRKYINIELDAYIEEANRQWLGKGPITFNGQKVGYSDGKGNIK